MDAVARPVRSPLPIPAEGWPCRLPIPPDLTDDLLAMTPPALIPTPCGSRPRPLPSPRPTWRRPHNEGHGKRLTAAFEALEAFPALAESRNRMLALIAEERPRSARWSSADRVRRRARDRRPAARQQVEGPKRGKVDSRRHRRRGALARGRPDARRRAETFEFFERGKIWDAAPERFRLHAVAIQRAADRLAARPATRIATACWSPRCSTTSASSCSCTLPGLPQAGPRPRAHARGAPALRASRARRRPRAGRRRADPALEPPEVDRLRDRAPPRR